MKTNLTETNMSLQIPAATTPTGIALTETLRAYEAAHAVWMNTSVFTKAGEVAKAKKDEASALYMAAYRAHFPTHIIG